MIESDFIALKVSESDFTPLNHKEINLKYSARTAKGLFLNLLKVSRMTWISVNQSELTVSGFTQKFHTGSFWIHSKVSDREGMEMEGKGVGVEERLEFQGFLNKKETKTLHQLYTKANM